MRNGADQGEKEVEAGREGVGGAREGKAVKGGGVGGWVWVGAGGREWLWLGIQIHLCAKVCTHDEGG